MFSAITSWHRQRPRCLTVPMAGDHRKRIDCDGTQVLPDAFVIGLVVTRAAAYWNTCLPSWLCMLIPITGFAPGRQSGRDIQSLPGPRSDGLSLSGPLHHLRRARPVAALSCSGVHHRVSGSSVGVVGAGRAINRFAFDAGTAPRFGGGLPDRQLFAGGEGPWGLAALHLQPRACRRRAVPGATVRAATGPRLCRAGPG